MPQKYTQAIMQGEGWAGVAVSLNRIITKASYTQDSAGLEKSAYSFFYVTIAFIAVCSVLHEVVRRMEFSQYYFRRRAANITLSRSNTVMELKSLATDENHTANPNQTSTDADTDSNDDVSNTSVQTKDYKVRYFPLMKKIAVPAATVWMTFFVTLSIFPGITSRISSSRLGDWMPVMLIAVFNVFDLLGKSTAGWPVHWTKLGLTMKKLLFITFLRLVFIFLVIFCMTPAGHPIISGEGIPVVLMILIGYTNGYIGCAAMEYAPEMVDDHERETAGTIMAFMLLLGLLVGH